MAKSAPVQLLQPRKSPLQARSAQTVEIILEAAARILETKGLIACTTNAVAARAGVSIGSLYQYFPNRDALTVALIERETAPLLAEIMLAGTEVTFRKALQKMVAAAVTHQLRRPELARVIDFEERRLPLDERRQRVIERVYGAFVAALQLPGAPRVDDANSVAQDILAIVHGLVDAAGERGENDSTALEKRVMRAVSGYLT